MNRGRAARSAALLSAVLVVAGGAPAQAATPTIGADVSANQCGRPWSGAQDFAVVAVNTGLPTQTNPCLGEQLALARTSPGRGFPAVSVYVNTANPSPKAAAWWPTSDRTRSGAAVHTPYGRCTGGVGRACSYVYGSSLALEDLRAVPGGTAARWWLDVETANTWNNDSAAAHARGGASTGAEQQRNRAVLEGMTARFTASGAKVGLYALDHEFHDLIGTVPSSSPLSPLPSWLAGAGDQAAAGRVCSRPALAKGRVVLAQWTARSGSDRFDLDLACTVLSPAPKPKVAGTHRVHATLTAKTGSWASGTRLTYRWTRDGSTIGGATSHAYRTVKADGGHRLAVVVTGTRDGSSRAERTSAAVSVRR